MEKLDLVLQCVRQRQAINFRIADKQSKVARCGPIDRRKGAGKKVLPWWRFTQPAKASTRKCRAWGMAGGYA